MKPVSFDPKAFEEFTKWGETDKKTFKRISKLIKGISRTPFKGEGKPEPLKGARQGYWSRRIDKKNRLVYSVAEKEIRIVSCKGHYD